MKEVKNWKDSDDVKESKEFKDVKDSNDVKEFNNFKDSNDSEDVMDSKEVKESNIVEIIIFNLIIVSSYFDSSDGNRFDFLRTEPNRAEPFHILS